MEISVEPRSGTFVPVILKMESGNTPLAAVVAQQVSRHQLTSGLSDAAFIARVLTTLGTANLPWGGGPLDLPDEVAYLGRIKAGTMIPGADFLIACAMVAGQDPDRLTALEDRLSRARL